MRNERKKKFIHGCYQSLSCWRFEAIQVIDWFLFHGTQNLVRLSLKNPTRFNRATHCQIHPFYHNMHEYRNGSCVSSTIEPDAPIDISKFKHDTISCDPRSQSYWFYEKSADAFPGQAFGLQVDQILYHTKSPYQDILIFKSTTFGNVLVLNGIIQCTEKDEFAYQELITHVT